MIKPDSNAIWATIYPNYVECTGCPYEMRLVTNRTAECDPNDCPRYDEKEQEVLEFMDENAEMLKLIMWERKQ